MQKFTALERTLSLFTRIRAGEGRSVAILFSNVFLLLLTYYLIRPVREALILTEANPEIRSYAVGFQAALLLLIVPLYSKLYHHRGDSLLVQRVNLFLLSNLLIFAVLGMSGMRFGFVFYIWVGVFNVLMVSNFWAFAADLFNPKSGKRLFALIGVGATAGAWVGGLINKAFFAALGPYGLMLLACLTLAATLPMCRWAERGIPEHSRSLPTETKDPYHPLGGLHHVFNDRYLLLIAIMVVLINWITPTADYLLSEWVVREYESLSAAGELSVDKGTYLGTFYGGFFAWVTALTFLVQLVLVSRILLTIGVHGSLMVLPMMYFVGFAAIGVVPIFALLQVVLIAQRSCEYSLMNTTRHALFLPVSKSAKYEGKTTIETFFWRVGDLVFAGTVYIGLNVLSLESQHFLLLNVGLSVLLIAVAWYTGQRNRHMVSEVFSNAPPQIMQAIPPSTLQRGKPFSIHLDPDTFFDPDPGDLLTYSAQVPSHPVLPAWLQFDRETLTFSGTAPGEQQSDLAVEVSAEDDEGARVSTTLNLSFD